MIGVVVAGISGAAMVELGTVGGIAASFIIGAAGMVINLSLVDD